jgi:hypothetical protein
MLTILCVYSNQGAMMSNTTAAAGSDENNAEKMEETGLV